MERVGERMSCRPVWQQPLSSILSPLLRRGERRKKRVRKSLSPLREVSSLIPDDLLTGLPGADLVREGLAGMAAGRRTIPACLIAIGSPRLRQAGGDAYSRYNALLRDLVSFESALDRRLARAPAVE